MSVRAKVLALLSGLMAFLVAAAALSLVVRDRAHEGLVQVTSREVPLLSLAAEATGAHLDEGRQLERALRLAREASPDGWAEQLRAREKYEARAAEIWHRLQEARAVAAGSEVPHAQALAEALGRVDHLHNEYAARVREAFGHLDAGRRAAALTAAGGAAELEDQLERGLADVLSVAAASAEATSSAARTDAAIAAWIVWALLAVGLLAAAAVFSVVFRLVSDVRTLSGLLPICAQCKKIRDDGGYWNQLEAYLQAHSHAEFTHGMCRDCQDAMRAKIAGSRPGPAVGAEAAG